jgi:predicted permease
MYTIIHEIRFTLRQLRKAPGFAITVLLTLALGIAATTVIFSVVDAVLLHPLPLPEPDRLVSLDTLERPSGSTGVATIRNETSYPNFFDWRSQSKSFSSMASYGSGGVILGADSDSPARHLNAIIVSSGFFTTLGVQPELGRDFTCAEEMPGAHVVVLSHSLWQTQFAGDRSILGKTVVLSDINYTVVGVMPAGFDFPVTNHWSELWISMARDAEGENPSTQQRGWNQVSVVGRLRPGVTLAQAKSEMDAIQSGLATRYADEDANQTAVSIQPQLQDIVSDVQTPLRILFAAVSCLLLIICANVAGMLLTRTSQRRSELAIRSALGATRSQILRQLLIESLVLSLAGGAFGIIASSALLKALPSLLPWGLPRAQEITLSGEVLAFAVALSILTGLLFGVLPAWQASRQDPAKALGDSVRGGLGGRRHYRLQSTLVVSQTALSLILLVVAGLLLHSFDRILKVDPGFSPQQMLTFRLAISPKRYSHQQKVSLLRQLIPSLTALPGVQSATAAYPMPLTEGDIHISFSIAGRPTTPGNAPSARVSLIEAGYFQTLHIPLKQGRFFLSSEQDEKAPPVVIVNEAFARRFFPGQDPIDHHIRSGLGAGDTPPMRDIVGVVGDVKRASLNEPPTPEYYIPLEQAPVVANPVFALRVAGNPDSYANTIRATIAKLDKSVPAYRLQSYEEDVARITAQQRFQALLISAFAAVALLLAALGLYATLSYMVAQRTTELGLRIALGAPRANVLQLMLFRGLKLAGLGLIAGLALAAVLSRYLIGLLYAVKPLDFATFAIMTAILLAVSATASILPAWRAAMLDPIESLRNQ